MTPSAAVDRPQDFLTSFCHQFATLGNPREKHMAGSELAGCTRFFQHFEREGVFDQLLNIAVHELAHGWIVEVSRGNNASRKLNRSLRRFAV